MHEDVKTALRTAITAAGATLQPLVERFAEPWMIWTKHDGNQWRGETQNRPSLTMIFMNASGVIDKLGSEFTRLLAQHHPEYVGMMGFRSLGLSNLAHQTSFIVNQTMGNLWKRHGNFQPPPPAVDAIVQEFSDFIDQPTARFRFSAELLNFNMDVDQIAFPKNLRIRRMTETEINDIHGGPLWQRSTPHRPMFGMHEFLIEGEYDEPKAFGNVTADFQSSHAETRRTLDRAVMALRTFKQGRIGYDYVRFEPIKFCPVFTPSLGYGDLYIPFDSYTISEDEFEPLRRHAELIFAFNDTSMETACSRLADAAMRLRPIDRIIDAVIGMECLLLAGLSKEDRRGELKFRFSLHYSTLFETPEERHRAFRVAKDLYDHRSGFAHGGSPSPDGLYRVGTDRLSLDETSNRATEALRHLITYFLAHASSTPYKRPEFWERRLFGLPLTEADVNT